MGDETSKPANRRKGRAKGYSGQPGGAKTLPWDRDPVILDRIRVACEPWMERRSPAECLQVVNAHLAARYPNEPAISLTTLYEDRHRAIELRKASAAEALDEHLQEYDFALGEAWTAFRDTSNQSLNRSAYLSLIAGIIEKKAKLDGTLTTKVDVTIKQQAAELVVKVLCQIIDSPELAMSEKQKQAAMTVVEEALRGQGN